METDDLRRPEEKNMFHFYGYASTVSGLQIQYYETVFTSKSPRVPGTHLIDLGRMSQLVVLNLGSLRPQMLDHPHISKQK